MARRWNELTQVQRTTILVLGFTEVVLTAAAAADLRRRPQASVHGPKALWWLGIVVQPFGPVAYLGWARHRRVGHVEEPR